MFRYYESAWEILKVDPPEPALIGLVPPGLGTTRELAAEAGRLLRFPGYCGANLDAFWDCVRTLEGAACRRVTLVHRDLPALDADRLDAYVELLRDAVLFWRERAGEHVFEVWFPNTESRRVEDILERLALDPNVE